jgi:hypothetical protein
MDNQSPCPAESAVRRLLELSTPQTSINRAPGQFVAGDSGKLGDSHVKPETVIAFTMVMTRLSEIPVASRATAHAIGNVCLGWK